MKYLELLERTLMEINMSPSALKQAAASIDARAGMEFEMIVPGIGSLDDDDFESEPDYDQDESLNDFEDIRNFFHDGDHNGRRAVDRLIEEIEQEYYDSDWLSEKKHEMWTDDANEIIGDLVERDYSDSLYDEAVAEVEKSSPEFGVSSEEFREAVDQLHAEKIKEKVDEILADMGDEYDEAFDEWENDKWKDIQNDTDTQREWLEYQGYHAMSDISNNFDIEWPYWTENDGSGGGGENAQRIADEFSEFINKKVNFSMNYHGGKREPNAYVVEPDGSLEGDDVGDQGLEFVSPPMPINELLADLIAVKQFAETNGIYTNDSTGLHINVSVPNFSMDKLDYVKLAILLGDERVLNEFGRIGNTYTKSALQIVKQNIKQRPEDAAALLGKMREHLSTAAAKAIHSGVTSKYTSINTKTGYIEFRSPGGDWLGANYDLIEPTLLRFVVALDAALDETKYRTEYAKKLYKLLAPSSDEPGVLELFANYSAGELDKDALIRQVRAVQLQRDIAKGKAPAGQKYWWNVQWDANRRIEVVAGNKDVARQVAAEEWGVPVERLAIAKVTMLRPYEPPAPRSAADNQGNWGIWIGGSNRFARQPNTIVADNVLRRFPSQAAAMAFLERTRGENPQMRTDVEVREIPSDYELPGTPAGRPVGPASQSASATEYEVFDRNTGATVDTFTANTDAEVARGINNYRTMGPHNLTPEQAEQRYGLRRAGSTPIARQPEFQEPNANRGDLTPRGPGPWEIYRLSDGASARDLSQTNRTAAETEARNALGLRGEAPELYGVRTRQQGSTGDTPARTATVPGQAQQRFTGFWDVKIGDEVVFRVQAETQGEANNKAREWVSQRSPEFRQQHQGGEVTVTPRYE